MHYNRHRYYDPSSGRFVSKGPIGLAGGINVYQYAPNPILWTDALGLARELSGCDSSNRPLSSSQYSVLHEVQRAPGQEVGSDPSHFREARGRSIAVVTRGRRNVIGRASGREYVGHASGEI
nr:RHS repeat-associated core domain-containing protein [Burkholderia seminalis]